MHANNQLICHSTSATLDDWDLPTRKRMARFNQKMRRIAPLPILRAWAYRAGLARALPMAMYDTANECFADWLSTIVRAAIALMEHAETLYLSFVHVRDAVMIHGGENVKAMLRHGSAFKHVSTFGARGLCFKFTARELYDLKNKRIERIEDDPFQIDVAGLMSEYDPDDGFTPEELMRLRARLISQYDQARKACEEYAAQIPTPSQDIINTANENEANTDGKFCVEDEEYEGEEEEEEEEEDDDDDDDDDVNDQADGIDEEAQEEQGNSAIDNYSISSPMMDAATLEYKDDVVEWPPWANKLNSGKIGDEGFSEQNHNDRVQKFSIDEIGLLCPVFLVKEIVRETLQRLGYRLSVTRDAMILFHHAIECFGVSLFEDDSDCGRVHASLAAADKSEFMAKVATLAASNERQIVEIDALKIQIAQLERNTTETSTHTETAARAAVNTEDNDTLKSEVTVLKDEVAQLKRHLKRTVLRANATRATLIADAADARAVMAREKAAQANAALAELQANAEYEADFWEDESAQDTPVAPRNLQPSRSSSRQEQMTQTPNPALHLGNASASSAILDASSSESPVGRAATGTMRKRTRASNPAADNGKRLRFAHD